MSCNSVGKLLEGLTQVCIRVKSFPIRGGGGGGRGGQFTHVNYEPHRDFSKICFHEFTVPEAMHIFQTN